MPAVFVSDAIREDRLAFGSPPGRGAPGWAGLSGLYQASFAAAGFRVEGVLRPEVYGSAEGRAVLGAGPGDWHLAVKPIEHLRPFHGLRNLFVCDWPFPEVSAAAVGGSPFFDQVRVLRRADAVLCTTGFTTATLRHAGGGVVGAVTLPPCVMPGQAVGSQDQGCGFVCVVESGSLPRQLGFMLEGFALAAEACRGLRLSVRVRGGGAAELAGLRRRAAEAGCGAGVEVVADEGGGAGEFGAQFFLCAHAAPGLFLPLAEAARAGMPLVATRVAGTASFLPAEACVAVAAEPDLLDGDGEPIGRFMPLTSHPAGPGAVRDAVLAAAALDAPGRRRMGEAAREAAERQFGAAAFAAGLGRLREVLAERVAERVAGGRG